MVSEQEQNLEITEFFGLTLRPVTGRESNVLVDIANWRPTQEKKLQIRAGTQKPKAIAGGGTSNSTAILTTTTGMILGAHTHKSRNIVILRRTGSPYATTEAGTWTHDFGNQDYFDYFGNANVGSRCYFVSPGGKFSTLVLNVGRAAAGLTFVWKYSSPTGDQTLTAVTENFGTTGERVIEFSPPSDWGGGFYQGYFGFMIYVEIATSAAPTIPTQWRQKVTGDWSGRWDLIVGFGDTVVSPNGGKISRYGVSDVTPGTLTVKWDGYSLIDSSLSLGNNFPMQFATNNGVLYMANGIKGRRWDGKNVSDLGFTAPSGTLGYAAKTAGNLNGIYLYAITYGYGPDGEWGESSPLFTATVDTPGGQQVNLNLPAEVTTLTVGIVDRLYIYRSIDLTTTNATHRGAINSFVYKRIATIQRDNTGAFPTTYGDNTVPIPYPSKDLDIRDRTFPKRPRFLMFHKNRMVVVSSDKPNRLYRSYANEWEAFNQNEDFQDFPAEITGIVEFADMVVVYTPDATYGLANLDQDDWVPFVIHPEIGCVATNSVRVGYGLLIWLAKNGIWLWDGEKPPERISEELQLNDMSVVIHGMSRAVIYDYGYEIELMPWNRSGGNQVGEQYANQWPAQIYASLYVKYFYHLPSKQWYRTTFANSAGSEMQPIAMVLWPHFTNYEGRLAPLYGRHQQKTTSANGHHVIIGDAGATDDGTSITGTITIAYPTARSLMLSPGRFIVQAKGMTPVTLAVGPASVVGFKPDFSITPFSDGSTEYNSYEYMAKVPGKGVANLQLTWIANQSSTQDRDAYLFSAALFASYRKIQNRS